MKRRRESDPLRHPTKSSGRETKAITRKHHDQEHGRNPHAVRMRDAGTAVHVRQERKAEGEREGTGREVGQERSRGKGDKK